MKITRLGHCCLVIEITPLLSQTTVLRTGAVHLSHPKTDAQGLAELPVVAPHPLKRENKTVRIMTDPGAWSTLQNEAEGIDYVFITHEHQDHFHVESLKTVLKNNPKAKVVTNSAVGKLLDADLPAAPNAAQAGKISYELLEHGGTKEFSGIHVEGHGENHEVIYESFGQVQNTGYFFGKRFFYPGDAFFNPQKPVEILALPVAGPWMKISDAIDYAKLIKPKVCFPVHDGGLKCLGPVHVLPGKILPPLGIEFTVPSEGTTKEF